MKHGEDYGAAMLQALETKLQAGEITQAQHDAERERALEAIRRGDSTSAAEAMRAHLTASRAQWERYTGYGDDYPGAGIAK